MIDPIVWKWEIKTLKIGTENILMQDALLPLENFYKY